MLDQFYIEDADFMMRMMGPNLQFAEGDDVFGISETGRTSRLVQIMNPSMDSQIKVSKSLSKHGITKFRPSR